MGQVGIGYFIIVREMMRWVFAMEKIQGLMIGDIMVVVWVGDYLIPYLFKFTISFFLL
jgi:hypothetical protein